MANEAFTVRFTQPNQNGESQAVIKFADVRLAGRMKHGGTVAINGVDIAVQKADERSGKVRLVYRNGWDDVFHNIAPEYTEPVEADDPDDD